MEGIFDAIRGAASASVWSRGVELARAEAVSGDRYDETEVQVRVATRGGMVSPSVVLHLDDEEWECSCSSREDPCEHVAAAVIAVRRARHAGQGLPTSRGAEGRLRYLLASDDAGRLELDREVKVGGKVHPLRTTLDSIARGRVDGPRFAASKADVDVELALGSRRAGPIAREHMPRLVDALAGCEEIWLDDHRIQASAERIGPVAVVEDADGGFRVRVERDARITRFFQNGSVLCGDTLHVVGESRLTGREIADLPEGRFYANDRAAELVSEVLPSLRERVNLEIRTTRLPELGGRARPRVQVQVERRGDALSVLAHVVYGDPPSARVDAGRLVHLEGRLPVRDTAAESLLVRQLRRDLGLSPGHRVDFRGQQALAMSARLDAFGGELRGEAHRAFHRAAELVPALRVSDDRVELSFEAPADPEAPGEARRVAAADVLRAWREGEPDLWLADGGLAPLPHDWLERFGDRVADLLAARDEQERVPTCALPDLGALCEELDEPPPPSLRALAPLLEDGASLPRAERPADLRAELRPYQEHGVDWLAFLGEARLGGLLADDMGLGKTIQALCAVRGRSLVVAPTSVLHGWRDEAARFRPALRLSLYHGPARTLDPDADVTLTSYALLRMDATLLGEVDWDVVVLDEAQAIKNPDSQVARAAYGLRAVARVALTGTPVENRLEELWSQLHFLNPGLLGSRRDFQERYARPIGVGDAGAAHRLRARLAPFVLRRLKVDVAPELPPRTEVLVHCTLDEDERGVYDAIAAATRRDVVARLRAGGNVLEALEALLRLRQASCHSDLIPGQTATRSSKVDQLLERLEQAAEDGHRALVFSQWTQLLDRVEPHLREHAIEFERLDGSTRDRPGVIGRFQSDDGPPVMLLSLKAGGAGLNLTAADHVFLLDPWWNPAVEDQAADRAHRIGQTRPVFVHRLIAEETVEERILALQDRKRELAQAVLDGADPAASLSREELIELLA